MRRLSHYPELEAWYQQSRSEMHPQDILFLFKINTCKVLAAKLEEKLAIWHHSLAQLIEHSKNPVLDFLAAEKFFGRHQLDYLELASEISEFALASGCGDIALKITRDVSEKTNLSVFRFLCAWCAFNLNEYDYAIEQCDAIDDPFACVYTLMGQCYLETHDAKSAIQCLEIAIDLSPEEILAHFQLAKAYFASTLYEKAWASLESCSKIAPDHPEIEVLQALVALHSSKAADLRANRLRMCKPKILKQFRHNNENIELFFLAHDVIFELNEPMDLENFYAITNWGSLCQKTSFMKGLPSLLRKFDEKGWQRYSKTLLENAVEQAESGSLLTKSQAANKS